MAIIVNLDVMLARRKMSLTELSEKVGITISNLSILKKEKQKPFVFQRWKPSAKFWNVSLGIFWNSGQKSSIS